MDDSTGTTGPLSAFQQGFWLEYQRDPTSPRFNRGTAIRIDAGGREGEIEDAWHRVVARHPMLRATIESDDTGVRQVIRAPARDTFRHIDARGLSPASLVARIQEEIDRPFDLVSGPVVRGALVDTDDGAVFLTSKPHVHADIGAVDLIHHEIGVMLGGGELAPVLGSYLDFARRQAAMLDTAEGERLRAYWSEQLASAPKVLALPTDKPRVAGIRPYQRSHAFQLLDAAESARLKQLCSDKSVTRFRFLLSLWCAFLFRYTRQEDFLVGSPVDCRSQRERDTIGNFANMMVLRSRVERTMSFDDLLAQVDATLRAAIEHRDYPLVRVIGDLLPREERGATPLYQTGFAMGRMPRCHSLSPLFIPTLGVPWRGSFGPVKVTGTVPFYQHGGQLELELLAADFGDVVGAEIKYDDALFEKDTIVAMCSQLREMLLHLLENVHARVGELRMISDAERRVVVEEWNATERPFEDGGCMHHAIERQCCDTPAAVALRYGGVDVTYAELDAKATALAAELRRKSVGPESRVALLLPRSSDFIIAILAVWKAGGAYVPVDPTYPEDRVRFMLRDAEPVVTLVTPETRDRIDASAKHVVFDSATLEAVEPLERAATDARSLAYVIYTSGSTGTPKGVLVEHRGVCNYASDLIERWRIEPRDRVLAFASFSFDSSVADIVSTLSVGATLVIRPPDIVGGSELAKLLTDNAITHADLPPAVWATIPEGETLPALRTAISSGDACSAAVTARFAQGRLMLNEYGPTENTVCSTSQTCVPGIAPSIGKPISNVKVFVLDEELAPCPIGVPGELYLTGVGIARGYLHRDDLTREKFVDCPFVDGWRMYRSGDIGRWLRNGSIEFLGRTDDQVKIRGFRVELGEVEDALRKLPRVANAVVIVREVAGRKQLAAYVVPERQTEFAHAEARRRLRTMLPRHMIPAYLTPIDALPLTPHGKIDRQRLPEPVPDPTFEVARTESGESAAFEDELRTAWKRVLGVASVGPSDDFFDVGGDSLLVLELLQAVADISGAEVGVDEFFRDPTFGALVRRLGEGGSAQLGALFEWPHEGDHDPIFLMHPPGGEVAVYDALARKLSDAWAPVGVRATAHSPIDLEALASAHADAIAARAQGAPLRIVGWSAGGLMALAVARELERRNLAVECVVLIDTHVHAQQESAFASVAPDLGSLAGAFGGVATHELEEIGRTLAQLPPYERRRAALELARSRGLVRQGFTAADDPLLMARSTQHEKLLAAMTIPTLAAPVFHIQATDSVREPAATWDNLRRPLTQLEIGGSHYGVLREPTVGALAQAVGSVLADRAR